MNRVLNVGGGSKDIKLPPQYDGWEAIYLDIDPACKPDIICDARELTTLAIKEYVDAVYCSHNLEHFYRHDVPRVLAGFMHVLKPDGFAQVMVPDIHGLMQATLERELDIDDVLYHSAAGPVRPLDMLYGLQSEIEKSGRDYYQHKTGFTLKSLTAALVRAGFGDIYGRAINLEVFCLAFKTKPNDAARVMFEMSGGEE